MSSRTPRPRTPPTTLIGLVLDLESRLHGGDSLTEVVLPHDEWTPLVTAAQDEHERELDAPGEATWFESRSAICRTLGIAESSSDTDLFIAVKTIAHPPPPAEEDEDRAPGGFLNKPPEVLVWRSEGPDDKGEVRVRLLLGEEGCVINPEAARGLMQKIAAGLSATECKHCGRGHDSARCKSKPEDRLPPRGGKRSAQPRQKSPAANPRVWQTNPELSPGEKPKARAKPKGTPEKKAPAKIIPGVTPFIAPFHIRVGKSDYQGEHRTSDGAIEAAQQLGLYEFSVIDGRGRIPYSYRWSAGMPKPKQFKPSKPKKKAAAAPKPKKATPGMPRAKPAKKKAATTGSSSKRVNMDERVKAELERGLILDAGRRLNGAGWKRSAKKARDENSTTECHHCGAGPDGDAGEIYSGGLGFEQLLSLGALCGGCRLRLRENPREFDRHSVESGSRKAKKPAEEPVQPAVVQVTLEEAIGRTATVVEELRAPAPPLRPTKKFPLQSGPTEKCTQCGAEQGDHAGTKCPFPSTAPQEIPAAAPPQAELSQ